MDSKSATLVSGQSSKKNSSDKDAMSSAMQTALSEGTEQRVKQVLDLGFDVNTQVGKYGTALQTAIYYRKEQTIKLLLNYGADVNIQAGEHGTALQAAASHGMIQIVKLLLDHGADDNAQSEYYGTALQCATCFGREETVKLLLDHGADINAQGGDYGNALQAAASRGKEQMVRLLLKHGADVNAQGGHYGSALQAAVSQEANQIIKLLLDHGADINAQGGRYGNALQAAAYQTQRKTVELLLDCGADINAQGGIYGNALQAAASYGAVDKVKLLLDRGADVNALGGQYGNPLQAAASHGAEQTVRLLLDRGADVTIQPLLASRFSLLHVSIMSGKPAVLMTLFSEGGDIHLTSQDDSGQTPLHLAVKIGDTVMVKYLLDNGASPDTADLSDTTVLQSAMQSGNPELALLIYPKVKVGLSLISATDWRRCFNHSHVSNIEIVGGEAASIDFWGDEVLRRKLTEMSYPCPVTTTQVPATEKDFMNKYRNIKRIFILSRGSVLLSQTPSGFYCRWWCRTIQQIKGMHNVTMHPAQILSNTWHWVVRVNSAPSNNIVRQNSPETCFLQCGLSLRCLVLPSHLEDSTKRIQLSETFVNSLQRYPGIMWVMLRPDSNNINSPANKLLLHSRIFFSTSEYAAIPTYATDLFLPLIREVQDIWNDNFAVIHKRLQNTRSRVLRSSGNDRELIGYLLNEAQLIEVFHETLKEHVETLQSFRKQYSSEPWRVLHEQPLGPVMATMDRFEEKVRFLCEDGEEKLKNLTNLSQTIIQLEFNLTSISEAQKSTSTNRSMKRLSWITVPYLEAAPVSG